MDFKIKFKEAVFVRDEFLDFQEKTVAPKREVQEVVADTGFDGLKKVTVKEIPSNLQDVSATTAKKETVLQGEKFISADGLLVEGSMPNNGAVIENIDTQKTSYTIPKGYHNGEGTVSLFVESKTIAPTKTTQIVKPSNGKVLSEVNIEPIPEEYINPKGSVSITENGSYNVRDYKDAVVNVPIPAIPEGTKTITENGTYDVTEFAEAVVEVPKIDLTQATATEADVKEGKTFYAGDDTLKVGTNAGVDKIQKMIDTNNGSCSYLFYNYWGQSVDELMAGIDTSNVKTTKSMFNGCTNLTSVPLFDTSNVTSTESMFEGCIKLKSVPLFDAGNVAHSARMFNNCASLTTVPAFNMINNKNMSYMFYGCRALSEVPLFDTSNVNDMGDMFQYCTNLTSVPLFDTGNVTKTGYMFDGCTNLTSVPLFNTEKVVDMYYMFRNCASLTTVPAFNMINNKNMSYMFEGCTELTTVPSFNSRAVTSMNNTFNKCVNLTSIQGLDMRSALYTSTMFSGCSSLNTCLLHNIPGNIQVGSGTSWGHLLTMDSLLNLLNETYYYTSGTRILTVGTANLAKFTGDYEYVKLTGEIVDADDNPCELVQRCKIRCMWCSSTDEGAMTVAEYMTSKGWKIA